MNLPACKPEAELHPTGARFLFIAGDILQGTPLSTVFRGKPDVEAFNAMGVDALAVGNHEFDFGRDNFDTLRRRAAFPFLSANIRLENGWRLLCDPMAAFPLGESLSLAVIGLTTRELTTTTLPAHVAGLTVEDPVASVRREIGRRQGRGPLILLSHSRHATDRRIAAAAPELDLIIAGHDHLLFDPGRVVEGIPMFQALDNGRYLGRVDLAVDPSSGRARVESAVYLPITARLSEDPEVAAIVSGYRERLGASFKEVIGRSEVFLDGRRARVRYEETALGNFVTDVMREYAATDIALLNSGALRDSIDPGPITLEQILRVLPFDIDIVRLELSGAELLEALTRSVRGARGDEDGGFLQVSGIRFAVRGHRVEKVRVGPQDKPLDIRRTYTVAVPDFLASGGDGYARFAAKQGVRTRLPLREVVADAVRTRGSIAPAAEKRISRMETP